MLDFWSLKILISTQLYLYVHIHHLILLLLFKYFQISHTFCSFQSTFRIYNSTHLFWEQTIIIWIDLVCLLYRFLQTETINVINTFASTYTPILNVMNNLVRIWLNRNEEMHNFFIDVKFQLILLWWGQSSWILILFLFDYRGNA